MVALAVCLAVATNGARAADAPRRPNLLFVLIDTLRADALGAYGQALPTSPRIDALAKNATVYERAWTQYTWTGPSYVSYMTSRYARTHGWDYKLNQPDTFRALDDRAPMLAEVLKGAGYATSAQHSQPNLRQDLNFHRGFDAFVRGADVGVVRGAVADIGRWKADGKPNFLYVHLMAPHVPLLPTAEARAAVGAPANLPKALSYDHWTAAPADRKAAALEELRRTYLAGVRDADTYVGTLLDALAAQGLTEETVIVIASDHGELLGEQGQIGHMGTVAEPLTHVPLIVYRPGMAGRRVAAPASMIDVAPTLAELARAPIPSAWQGISLLKGGSPLAFSERDAVSGVTDGAWKIVETRADGTFQAAYDLSTDPLEKAKRDAKASPNVAKLEAAADAWRARAPDQDNKGALPTLEADEKAKKMEELRALGYIE
jgi:arylsulfatase A-like enzyme